MKFRLFRLFIEGAGITMLSPAAYLLLQLLSPYHLDIYHDCHSRWANPAGFALDLLLGSLLFACLLGVLDHFFPERSTPLWAAVLAFIAMLAADSIISLLDYYRIYIPQHPTATRVGVLLSVCGIGLLLSRFSSLVLRKFVSGARLGLALLGCCILWIIPELTVRAIRTHAPTAIAFERPMAKSSPGQPRIVWILLDELSYDLVFEHRQADVELPHFDQLKKESVMFSDVQPEGYYTRLILPALILGRRVDGVRSSLERDLEIHDVAAAGWVPFNQSATIFADAKREGWTTGVVGWYNPYCHILRDVLNSCYWYSLWTVLPGTHPGEEPTLAEVMEFPLKWAAGSSQSPTSDAGVKEHTLEHANLMNAAESLIKNEEIDFEFIHLPVPHPPGIYDRKTGTLGVPGSYLDNLVLADKDMGQLLDLIGKTSSRDCTTLIISSDHSFRVTMWRDNQVLTPEGMRATGGKFDPRPVLMIRFPNQSDSEVRSEAFPLLGIHGILEAMLKGEIRSQADLDHWLAVHEAAGEQVLAEKGE